MRSRELHGLSVTSVTRDEPEESLTIGGKHIYHKEFMRCMLTELGGRNRCVEPTWRALGYGDARDQDTKSCIYSC